MNGTHYRMKRKARVYAREQADETGKVQVLYMDDGFRVKVFPIDEPPGKGWYQLETVTPEKP